MVRIPDFYWPLPFQVGLIFPRCVCVFGGWVFQLFQVFKCSWCPLVLLISSPNPIFSAAVNRLKWYDDTYVSYNNWRNGRPNLGSNFFLAGVNQDGFWDIYDHSQNNWLYWQFGFHTILVCKLDLGKKHLLDWISDSTDFSLCSRYSKASCHSFLVFRAQNPPTSTS